MRANDFNGAALAYLGDAVFELLVRERVLEAGPAGAGELNRRAAHYVRATVQSEAAERLLPCLDKEEAAVYRRGRNAHTSAVPHSATPAEYRRATGLEALFAYLYLEGREDRMRTLFRIAFPADAQPADGTPSE